MQSRRIEGRITTPASSILDIPAPSDTHIRWSFDQAGLARIVAVTRPEHARSRHVLEKLGMRYERDVDVFGIHAVLYALTSDAFAAAR